MSVRVTSSSIVWRRSANSSRRCSACAVIISMVSNMGDYPLSIFSAWNPHLLSHNVWCYYTGTYEFILRSCLCLQDRVWSPCLSGEVRTEVPAPSVRVCVGTLLWKTGFTTVSHLPCSLLSLEVWPGAAPGRSGRPCFERENRVGYQFAQLVRGSEGVVRPLFRALPHQTAQPEPGTSVGLPPLWPWCAPWPRSAVQAAPFGAALHLTYSPRLWPCRAWNQLYPLRGTCARSQAACPPGLLTA